jgi:hypothetical protein
MVGNHEGRERVFNDALAYVVVGDGPCADAPDELGDELSASDEVDAVWVGDSVNGDMGIACSGIHQ